MVLLVHFHAGRDDPTGDMGTDLIPPGQRWRATAQ